MPAKSRSVHLLRILALCEAVSFLVLLGVAMPLKYLAGRPEAVLYVGWAHGALFIAFCVMLLYVFLTERWSLGRAALVFIAALLPFGPFIIDRRLTEYENETRHREDGASVS